MELSPARQKLLFVVIVLALAVVGYTLVVPALHSHGAAAKPPATPSVQPAAGSSSAGSPSAAPVATQVPAGSVNIYAWLPFTQQDLAAAAAVAVTFGVDYDTFTYTESAAGYVGKMGGLITFKLAAILQNAYSTPGVAGLRTGQQQVSTATASIVSLRGFGPSSLIFLVNVAQRLAGTHGTSNGSTPYAVTLTGSAGNWQVSDIEFATAGNA
jgi:hypothetical protein